MQLQGLSCCQCRIQRVERSVNGVVGLVVTDQVAKQSTSRLHAVAHSVIKAFLFHDKDQIDDNNSLLQLN